MKDDSQSSSLDFEREPFKLCSDLSFLFESNAFQHSFARLVENFETSEPGTALLTGQPGTGKTLLIKKLASKLERGRRPVFYFSSPANSFDEMLAECARHQGIANNKSVKQDAQAFITFLEQRKRAKPAVLIIDEADHILSSSLIGAICALTSREQSTAASLQVLLSAEAHFSAWLERQKNYAETISGALTCRVELEPLNALEVGAFIQRRLDVAVSKRPGLFTENAIALIATISGGLPGRIMSLCSQALMLARMESRPHIDKDIIERAATDLGQTPDDHVFEVLHTAVFGEAPPERTPTQASDAPSAKARSRRAPASDREAASEPEQPPQLIDRLSILDDDAAQPDEPVDAESESLEDTSSLAASLPTDDTETTDEPVEASPETVEPASVAIATPPADDAVPSDDPVDATPETPADASSTGAAPPAHRPRRRWRLGAGAVAVIVLAAAMIGFAQYPPWAADKLNAGWRFAQTLGSDSYEAVVAIQASLGARLFANDDATSSRSASVSPPQRSGDDPSEAVLAATETDSSFRLAAQTALYEANARQRALETERDALRSELDAQRVALEQANERVDAQRQALEEAFGTKQAQAELTDANRTLEERVGQLEAALESERAERKQQTAALDERSADTTRLEAQRSSLNDDLTQARTQLASFEEKYRTLEAELAALTAELDASKGRISAQQQEIADASRRAADVDQLASRNRALDDELTRVRSELETAKAAATSRAEADASTESAAIEALEATKHTLETSLSELRADLAKAQQTIAEREQAFEASSADAKAAQQELAALRSSLEQSNAERLTLADKQNDLQGELSRMHAELETAKATLAERDAALQARTAALDEATAEQSNLNASLETSNAKQAALEAERRALEEQTATLRSELENSRERESERDQALNARLAQAEDTQRQLADANAALAALEAEQRSLAEKSNALENEVSRLQAEQQRSIAIAQQQQGQLAASSDRLKELETERDRLQANLQAAIKKSSAAATQVSVVPAAAAPQPGSRKASSAEPAEPSAAASPGAQPETQANRDLIARGEQYLSLGDIASARLFFELAAKAGSAGAATAVAKTYDPLFYRRRNVVGTRADPAKALQWYRKAVQAGDPTADPQRRQLMAWLRRAAARGDSQARQLLERN